MNEKKQIEEEEKMITLFEKEIEKKLPVRMDAHMPAGSRVKAIELEIRPFRNLYEVVIDKKTGVIVWYQGNRIMYRTRRLGGLKRAA